MAKPRQFWHNPLGEPPGCPHCGRVEWEVYGLQVFVNLCNEHYRTAIESELRRTHGTGD